MTPTRPKRTNRASKAKNVIASPLSRKKQSKKKTVSSKSLADENKLSIRSPKTSQKSLNDYYKTFSKSPTSIEEMCVKMTLDEFKYNTNIIELVKEYWLQKNHPKKVLAKLMNNLDSYIERVYNLYVSKPKYRRDDIFKKLKILQESINIEDAADSDSKCVSIRRKGKDNTKKQKRKRKVSSNRSSSESENLSDEFVGDDTSCDDANSESANDANKRRKLTRSQTTGRKPHSNQDRPEDLMNHNVEMLSKKEICSAVSSKEFKEKTKITDIVQENFNCSNQIIKDGLPMVVIPSVDICDTQNAEARQIEKLSQLNKKGTLMTKKPCPLSKKVKYMLEATKTNCCKEIFNDNKHQRSGAGNANILPKTAQTSLKDYYENFSKSEMPQPQKPASNEKGVVLPARNSASPTSIEEMCVKMTLDEFKYNTNIIELVKEYWQQKNHTEKVLAKLMNNLDSYIERVYNLYVSKPKYRRDDIFKKLKILPESINIEDAEDSDSKCATIRRKGKYNTKKQQRKRKVPSNRSSNSERANDANKMRKVTRSKTAERKPHFNQDRQDLMNHDVEIQNKECQFDKKLRRFPSPQEGCSKWLYKSDRPSENSFANHECHQSKNINLPNEILNPKKYDLSPKRIEEICSVASSKEFKEETNISDIIKENFNRSNQLIKDGLPMVVIPSVYIRESQNSEVSQIENLLQLNMKGTLMTKKPCPLSKKVKYIPGATQTNCCQEIFNSSQHQRSDAGNANILPNLLSSSNSTEIQISSNCMKRTLTDNASENVQYTDVYQTNTSISNIDTNAQPCQNRMSIENKEEQTYASLCRLHGAAWVETGSSPATRNETSFIKLGSTKSLSTTSTTSNGDNDNVTVIYVVENETNVAEVKAEVNDVSRYSHEVEFLQGEDQSIVTIIDEEMLNEIFMPKDISYASIPTASCLTIENQQANDNVNGDNDTITFIHVVENETNVAEVKAEVNDVSSYSDEVEFLQAKDQTIVTIIDELTNTEAMLNEIFMPTDLSYASNPTASCRTIENQGLALNEVVLPTISNESLITANLEQANDNAITSSGRSSEVPPSPEVQDNSSARINHTLQETEKSSIENAKFATILSWIKLPSNLEQANDNVITSSGSSSEVPPSPEIQDNSSVRNNHPVEETKKNSVENAQFPTILSCVKFPPNLEQANDNVIASSGSSSEVTPAPEIQDNCSARTNHLVEETKKSSIENATFSTILSSAKLPNLNPGIKRSYSKLGNKKSPSKFSPLEFLSNAQATSSAKPRATKIIETQASDEIEFLEDLIEEEISQQAIDHSQGIETSATLQTNSQLLNADITYLRDAKIPSPIKEIVISAPPKFSKNITRDLLKSVKPPLTTLHHNVQLPVTLNRPLTPKHFICLTFLDIRSVVFGKYINRFNYESNSPFLEKSNDKQVRATIKVNLGRCRSLHIVGKTLQILFGFTNKEWCSVMKLFDVIELFEFQSTDPEPTNKSLPHRILYYLFKTLPKFSQATLHSMQTGSDDQVSCVNMNINYFKPICCLKQAFQPMILAKLKAYNTSL